MRVRDRPFGRLARGCSCSELRILGDCGASANRVIGVAERATTYRASAIGLGAETRAAPVETAFAEATEVVAFEDLPAGDPGKVQAERVNMNRIKKTRMRLAFDIE